nr:hypothetical protein [uncultured bacterium]
MDLHEQIEQDIWAWLREFVSVPNEFYDFEYAPCPFARGAIMSERVDVVAWRAGDFSAFIRKSAGTMRDVPKLQTRVIAFPPRAQFAWGISEFVEALNMEVIADNLFLNTGLAKTSESRYPGANDPYFIVVVNSLDAVLLGTKALQKSAYYDNWPKGHYGIVVERRARLAERYGAK